VNARRIIATRNRRDRGRRNGGEVSLAINDSGHDPQNGVTSVTIGCIEVDDGAAKWTVSGEICARGNRHPRTR
jgi:hypothetical protein